MESLSQLAKKKRKVQDTSVVLSQKQQKPPPTTKDEKAQMAWKEVIKHFSTCVAAEGIRETSVFRDKSDIGRGGVPSSNCLRRLLQELGNLPNDLPTDPAVWVRFDEESPQFMRALITAPTDTPYSLGLFCFDIFCPSNYPNVPVSFSNPSLFVCV
jgi:hypothetical protein